MHPLVYVGLFLVCALVGYKIITNVPSLLHTPLMTAMNALAGIALLGALTSAALAVHFTNSLLAYLAVLLAAVNIAGGFGLSHRMLKMFKQKEVEKQ